MERGVYPPSLRNQAETIAAGRPYCVSAQIDGVFVGGLANWTFLTIDKGSNRSLLARVLSGAPATPRLVVPTGTPQDTARMQSHMGDTALTHLSDVIVRNVPLSPFGKWNAVEPVSDLAFQCVPRMDDLRAPRDGAMRGFATVLGDRAIPADLMPGRAFSRSGDLRPWARLATRVEGNSFAVPVNVFVAAAAFALNFTRDEIARFPDAERFIQRDSLLRVDTGISPVFSFMLTPQGTARTEILCYDARAGGEPDQQRPAVCIHRFLKPADDGGPRMGFTLRYPPKDCRNGPRQTPPC